MGGALALHWYDGMGDMVFMDVRIGGPFKVTTEMKHNVTKVLDSGRLSSGPFVAEFEREFSKYHNISNAVMTNSGTTALIVVLQALKETYKWADGSEVICPAITFVATINAVLHCELKPVLVDVDPVTYTIDTDKVESKITSSTKAIIPVHVFGLPVDMVPIHRLAITHGLKIVEDACESLGATYNGKLVGALGDIGCFSFYMSHHITAGEGGMVITNNHFYAAKIRSLLSHGWDRGNEPKDRLQIGFATIRKRYRFIRKGYNFRPTELQAAVALPQLSTLYDDIGRRVDNAKILSAGLKTYISQLQLPICPYERSHSLMMYPIILREGDKWDLILHLEKAGIETREMLPLTNQPCYQGLFNEADYPIAKWINEQGFYVGCSQYLGEAEMDYVVETIGAYFG